MKKNVFWLLGIAMLIGFSACSKPSAPKPSASKPSAPKPSDEKTEPTGKTLPAVSLTAEDLAKEFTADPKAIHKKYAGKSIEVSGVVYMATSDNIIETARVGLLGIVNKKAIFPDSKYQVQCDFPEAEEERVNQLATGQRVKIRGTLNSTESATLLDSCEFIEFGPSPALTVSIAELEKEFKTGVAAARAKYHEKQLILEGKVVEVKWDPAKNFVRFTLESPAEGKSPGSRATVQCSCVVNKKIRAKLEEVQVGQTVKVRVDCQATEYDESPRLIFGKLLK